jgi:hypothetical protein
MSSDDERDVAVRRPHVYWDSWGGDVGATFVGRVCVADGVVCGGLCL